MISLIDDSNITEVRAVLPTWPYYRFLASHKAMASALDVVLPRLHDSFASSDLEWYMLYLTGMVSNFVGGHHVGCLVHATALNSRSMIASEDNEIRYLYCVTYHDQSCLPSLAAFTKGTGMLAYTATCMLVDRAFRHEDLRLLSNAVDRLSFYDPQDTLAQGHPLLEYEVAIARYRQLLGKQPDIATLTSKIYDYGNRYHKNIFIAELCTFLKLNPADVVQLASIAATGKEEVSELVSMPEPPASPLLAPE